MQWFTSKDLRSSLQALLSVSTSARKRTDDPATLNRVRKAMLALADQGPGQRSFVLARRKGTPSHKLLGWTWVLLMASTAGASALLRDDNTLNIGGITPIHALTVLTALILPRGIWQIRRGNVAGHRRSMRNLYLGACALAGVFALLPARFLGRLLWQHTLGFAA